MTQPLVVCGGMGQDSTGMLVGMWERGIKPMGYDNWTGRAGRHL